MGTILARTGLTKPARGDLNWDDEVQAWLDKLDTYGAFADETLTWTATQTFAAVTATTLAAPVATVTGSLAVGSTALAPGYFCQVLTAGDASTATDTGAEGDGIVLAAQPGQESTHLTGAGGAGGMATLSGGTGGVGATGGVGGTVLVQGGTGGATGGAQGNVRLNATDVLVDGRFHFADPDTPVRFEPIALTADNQIVTPTKTVVVLASDNATASNRTFTIAAPPSGHIGQLLILIWSGTNKGELIADSTTHLSATWPDATNPGRDTLTLIYDGTHWHELARSLNT